MILTPSSRKVDSRSARTPLITTAASHGSAAPAGWAARAGGGRGACCFCLPSRYPMSAPTAAPKPNATHRPMRENYARRGFARAAPYHGGLATPITGVLDHRGEPPYVSLPALVVELVDTLS